MLNAEYQRRRLDSLPPEDPVCPTKVLLEGTSGCCRGARTRARPRSGRLRIFGQISRRNRCQRSRTANIIDDVFNRADITDPESDREKIAELDSGSIRRFHPTRCNDGWIRGKVAVHAHPKALEVSNPILYFEGCKSVNPLMRKVCLGRRVIRHFALIEVIYPVFAIPDRLILLEMLDSLNSRSRDAMVLFQPINRRAFNQRFCVSSKRINRTLLSGYKSHIMRRL